jgi:hypothetical protein
MEIATSFTLTERFVFGSMYSWRLKEAEVRFRGSGDFERLVLQRIPASHERIAAFAAALDLLQVWEWRSVYDPNDCGWAVEDGSSWSFSASMGNRTCHCGGVNAYPSYADAQQTTVDRGRLALLKSALYDCFAIEAYIQQAQRFAARQAEQSGEPPVGIAANMRTASLS